MDGPARGVFDREMQDPTVWKNVTSAYEGQADECQAGGIRRRIPKTTFMPGKFEDLWSEGVWLGFDMRSENT